MKKMHFTISKRAIQSLAALGLMTLGSSAFAASTWTYSDASGTGSCVSTSSPVASLGCGTLGGVTMTASAFSTKASSSTNTFGAATLYNWDGTSGGLGVVNSSENVGTVGEHATDNQNGTDAILLQFNSAVTLTEVGIGWSGSNYTINNIKQDSDFSVLAYTGSTTGASTVTGATLTGTASTSTLLSTGWQLVSNYANTASNSTVGVSSAIYSSYWLVSAYNTAFGNSWTTGNDYFKLASISAAAGKSPTTGAVPEPGSLALIGAALMGFVAARRRNKKTN